MRHSASGYRAVYGVPFVFVALAAVMDRFWLNESLIITNEIEREENIKGKRVVFMPFWECLLKGHHKVTSVTLNP